MPVGIIFCDCFKAGILKSESMRALLNKFLFQIWKYKYKDIWYRKQARAALARRKSNDPSIRRTVRLVSNFPGLWRRTIEQTYEGACQSGGTLFVAEGEADLYLVLNTTRRSTTMDGSYELPSVTAERIWGLHMEPEPYVRQLSYDSPHEHSSISRFYTNCEHLLSKGGIYQPSPPYVHSITDKSWDFLAAAKPPDKIHNLGIICSSLSILEGHRRRLKFLDRLEDSGLDFAIWGRGKELSKYRGYKGFALSKWNAHSICRYSIVLENSIAPLYWTEKLADSLLSFSHPIYYGAPDAGEYFPKESFTPINIESPSCINEICDLVKSDTSERQFPALCEARQAILQTHNLHAFIDREADRHFHPLR